VVITYDGKSYEMGNWSEIIPVLSGKTFTLDQDYYFMMGDHRNNSNDSRSVGAVERSMVIGHVRRIVYPFGDWRGVR
jgi:signal peptidase I